MCRIGCPTAPETHGYEGVDEPALLTLEYWALGGCELEGWKRAVFCEVLRHGQDQGGVKRNERVLTGFLWFQSLFRYLDGLLDMVASQLQGDPGYLMGNYGETAL